MAANAGQEADLAVDSEKRDRTNDVAEPDNNNLNGVSPDASVTGIKLVFVIAALAMCVFLIMLDTSIISTAVPKITDDFHSLKDVGWYASTYSLGSAVLQLLTGKIYQCFSLKWSFVTFFFLFELGSALCGAAQSSTMLIISRAVSGIGASGLINGALTIVAASVALEKRPALTGIVMGVSQFGVVSGPLIGGAFTTNTTWRWCFYINLPLGLLVATPIILLRIPDQIPKRPVLEMIPQLHKALDLVGFLLFAPSIIMLLLAIEFGGNQFTWHSPQVIGLFVGSGVACIVWLTWNWYKGEEALLPYRIVKRHKVWMSGIYYTCLTSSLIGGSYFLPIYFQAVKGVSPITSGVYMLATILPQVLGAVASGLLVNKIGYVPPLAVFGAVLFSIGSGLYVFLQPDTSTANWVGFQILNGIGRGLGFQMPIVAVQNAVSPSELSAGMAFIVWCQYLGPSIFLTLFNTVFDTKLKTNLAKYAPTVNSDEILAAGATGFRKIVTSEQLPGTLKAYSDSIDIVFYMVLAVSLMCFISGWGMGFNDIRVKQSKPTDEKAADQGPPASGADDNDSDATAAIAIDANDRQSVADSTPVLFSLDKETPRPEGHEDQ